MNVVAGPAKQVRQTLFGWHPDKFQPAMALRAATGLTTTVVLGLVVPLTGWGPAAVIGAWTAGITLLVPGVRPRPSLPLLAGVAIGLAVLLGGLAGPYPSITILVTAGWALVMAFVGALGSTIGAVTTVCGVALVLAPSLTAGISPWQAALAAVIGGVVQAIAALLPPWSRNRPERLALALAFQELADYSRDLADSLATPLPTKSLLDVQTTLGDRRRIPDVLREAITQLYDMRAAIIAVGVARARLLEPDPTAARRTSRVLREASTALESMARGVRDQVETLADWEETLAASIDAGPSEESDIASTRHTIAGQEIRRLERALHRTARLAERVVNGEPATTVVSRRVRVRSRMAEDWQTFRANIDLRSPALRHAIRAAATIALATGLGMAWPGHHGFWLPLTAWIVLRPDFAATLGRGIERTLGTMAGAVLATALATLVANGSPVAAATVALFALAAYLVMPVSFFVFSAAVAGFAVFQIDLASEASMIVAAERGLATLLGGALAIALYWVWPSWQTRRLPELLADLIEAYRAYANLVLDFQARPAERDEELLREAVDEVRLRRSELTAAAEQAAAEPIGGPLPYSADVLDVEATLERAVRALIVLEGSVRRGDAAQLPGIDEFREAVDAAYSRLAYWIRNGVSQPPVDLNGALSELDDSLSNGSQATRRRRRLLDWESDILVEALNDARLIVAEWHRS